MHGGSVWGPRPPQGWGAGPLRMPGRRRVARPSRATARTGPPFARASFPQGTETQGPQGSCPPGLCPSGAARKSSQLWSVCWAGGQWGHHGSCWLGWLATRVSMSPPPQLAQQRHLQLGSVFRPRPSRGGSSPPPPFLQGPGNLAACAWPALVLFLKSQLWFPEVPGPWTRDPHSVGLNSPAPSFLNRWLHGPLPTHTPEGRICTQKGRWGVSRAPSRDSIPNQDVRAHFLLLSQPLSRHLTQVPQTQGKTQGFLAQSSRPISPFP